MPGTASSDVTMIELIYAAMRGTTGGKLALIDSSITMPCCGQTYTKAIKPPNVAIPCPCGKEGYYVLYVDGGKS